MDGNLCPARAGGARERKNTMRFVPLQSTFKQGRKAMHDVSGIPIEDQNFDDHLEGFIMCSGCDFTSDVYLDPEIAAKKWNRRANDE